LVISTILWIVSGVLIHSLWGVILCRQGVGHIRGGLTIIEIIAWVLAGLSVIATIPVLMDASKRKKQQAERKTETSGWEDWKESRVPDLVLLWYQTSVVSLEDTHLQIEAISIWGKSKTATRITD
jgi:Zn-dependent membrane protease YugP